MAYALHIERFDELSGEERPYSLVEWKAAVATVPGVRLFEGAAYTVTNPATGESIRFPVHECDAEVFFPSDQTWYPVFKRHTRSGTVSFNARFEPGDRTNPIWASAVALACELGAKIRGDEGETYDLPTGELVREE